MRIHPSRKLPIGSAGTALVVAAGLALAGCRGQSSAAPSGSPGSGASLRTLVIEMTLDDRASRDGQEYLRRTGTGTKWIDVAGNRRRDEFHGKVTVLGGSAKEVASTLVFDGKTAYSVFESDGRQTVAASADLTAGGRHPLVAKEGLFPSLGLDAAMKKSRHPPRDETFLGRACRVYASPDGTQSEWIWNGILLKAEVRTADQTVVEQATDVRENVPLEESRFAPPPGVRFEAGRAGPAWADPGGAGPWSLPFYLRAFGG
jgi:hypothetical protein